MITNFYSFIYIKNNCGCSPEPEFIEETVEIIWKILYEESPTITILKKKKPTSTIPPRRQNDVPGQYSVLYQLKMLLLRILIAWHVLFAIRTRVLLKIFISSFSTSFTSICILRVLIAQHEFGIFIFFCSIRTLLEMISFVQYGQNVTIWRGITNVYIITRLAFCWQDV